jgi:hypothetical protein
MLGWVEQTIGDRTSQVYVPLRIGQSFEPAPGQYVASVVPGVESSELFVTLASIGPDGRDHEYLKRDEPLKYGFYPAERPITVKVSGLPAAGLYRLRLGALLRRGGSSTATFVFYHPGTPTRATPITNCVAWSKRRRLPPPSRCCIGHSDVASEYRFSLIDPRFEIGIGVYGPVRLSAVDSEPIDFLNPRAIRLEAVSGVVDLDLTFRDVSQSGVIPQIPVEKLTFARVVDHSADVAMTRRLSTINGGTCISNRSRVRSGCCAPAKRCVFVKPAARSARSSSATTS